jgi:hypothetical protein
VKPGLAVIVYALAPELKMISFTSVLAESEIAVWLLVENVAVSEEPFGGPPAVQLAALFQSLPGGAGSHSALLPLVVGAPSISIAGSIAAKNFVRHFCHSEGAQRVGISINLRARGASWEAFRFMGTFFSACAVYEILPHKARCFEIFHIRNDSIRLCSGQVFADEADQRFEQKITKETKRNPWFVSSEVRLALAGIE